MTTVMWVNGQSVAANQPVISGLDRGLLLGFGVFETLAVENGTPFALTRHLRRLERSARTIGLNLPSEAEIRSGIDAAVAEWNTNTPDGTRGRLRLTITGGTGALGLPTDDPKPVVLIAISPAARPRKSGSAAGARAMLSPWPVNPADPLAGAKTISYAAHAVQQRYAQQHGVDELISATTAGQLCEGAISNVFVEIGGELLTPPLSAGCLAGITRELILEWGVAAGLPVREARADELPVALLDDVAHLAITGSVRGIMPVVNFAGRDLAPGPLTEEVAALFAQKSADLIDP